MTRDWPFGDLAPRRYGVILADPPWQFVNWSPKGEGRNANQHYDCPTIGELMELPVADLAAPNCVLFLWVTDPLLDVGMQLLKAWGFAYRTVGFYWVKQTKDGLGTSMGLGYWTRGNPEQCLLGTVGKPRRLDAGVRKLITAPRREHSRKPDEIRPRIERLVGGPYAELFARERTPGWDVWGHETDKFTQGEAAA